MAKSALARWQMGIILVLITLGLLGALLAQRKGVGASGGGKLQVEVTPGQMEVDVQAAKQKVPRYQQHYEESLKWSFYVFLVLLVLYFYSFTVSAYKNSIDC